MLRQSTILRVRCIDGYTSDDIMESLLGDDMPVVNGTQLRYILCGSHISDRLYNAIAENDAEVLAKIKEEVVDKEPSDFDFQVAFGKRFSSLFDDRTELVSVWVFTQYMKIQIDTGGQGKKAINKLHSSRVLQLKDAIVSTKGVLRVDYTCEWERFDREVCEI